MGTHPIFESDFDCLTDAKMETHRFIVRNEHFVKVKEFVKTVGKVQSFHKVNKSDVSPIYMVDFITENNDFFRKGRRRFGSSFTLLTDRPMVRVNPHDQRRLFQLTNSKMTQEIISTLEKKLNTHLSTEDPLTDLRDELDELKIIPDLSIPAPENSPSEEKCSFLTHVSSF